ncbi:MAG TPA: multicopper oxidase family protein [Gaiellaceae bacterium]|jgi:FtsP/CotA-like multicopper oxidase with cupredoxin domain|nr:multicopper oxidase family protein [Gaiellaceae bacterium]
MSDVSVELTAREAPWQFAPGRTIRGFTYNASVPGPLIEAGVGDNLRVRLTNELPQATTIHWHGVRVPAQMDGTEEVQRPVEPGETFEYRFVVPDAGTFWYHSHVNETEQLERGLYGALVVRGPDEPDVDGERVLHLDDLKLAADGAAAPFGDPHELHEGREGDVLLVNGREQPELEIAADQIERWRVVNAANTRFVRLSIGGRHFAILGTDGGLLPAPLEATEVLVTPGDRVELAVGPFAEGEVLEIEALPYDRGRGEPRRDRFGTLRVGAAAPSRANIPGTLRPIEPLVRDGAEPTRTVSMKALMHGGQHQHDDPVRVGELQVWDLVNETSQDHPFHLHGFFFQVVDEDGEPPATLSWEDTVNVPRKARVRIAWLPDDRPGKWMYHCHILEHHAMGMMAHFDVVR